MCLQAMLANIAQGTVSPKLCEIMQTTFSNMDIGDLKNIVLVVLCLYIIYKKGIYQ